MMMMILLVFDNIFICGIFHHIIIQQVHSLPDLLGTGGLEAGGEETDEETHLVSDDSLYGTVTPLTVT